MKVVYIVLIVVGSVIVIILSAMVLLALRRRAKRRRRIARATNQFENDGYQSTPVYTVPSNPLPYYQNQVPERISRSGDMYQVPLELVPSSFDYNAAGVILQGNYVLIKDLSMIENRSSVTNREEYHKQQPYNPNYQ